MSLPKLGIDIAKRTFAAALLRDGKFRHGQFNNTQSGFTQLLGWLSKLRVSQVHAVLEATGAYGESLALFLHEAGHQVSVVNPARIKAFARSRLVRNKTDRADAAVIALFAAQQEPVAWAPPPLEISHLRGLVRHLDDLLQHRAQLRQRLTEGHPVGAVRESLQTLVKALDEQIAETEKQIRQHIKQHPGLKADGELLRSIPGIGYATAARLLAEMRQLRRFASARQAAAYAGLTPHQRQSGATLQGQARLSKIGNARVRKALYLPAMTAIRFNPLIGRLAERMRQRGKKEMVIIGAAMRKLIHLAYGVLKTGKPFDSAHAQIA